MFRSRQFLDKCRGSGGLLNFAKSVPFASRDTVRTCVHPKLSYHGINLTTVVKSYRIDGGGLDR